MADRKDSSTSYTTQTLKRALASARVRKALEELRESKLAFETDPEVSDAFEVAARTLEDLMYLLDHE